MKPAHCMATWSAALLTTGLVLCCIVPHPGGPCADDAAAAPISARRQADTKRKGNSRPAATPPAAGTPARGKSPIRAWTKNLVAWRAEADHEEADNSFCYVCHLNYEAEKLVKHHAPVGVGCETCHGISDKHSEDEDNITPPDVMFPPASIVSFCVECHPKETLMEEESHEKIFSKSPDRKKETCTSCHGKKHRLKVRTRKWNEETGKLDWYDGVRMMKQGSHR